MQFQDVHFIPGADLCNCASCIVCTVITLIPDSSSSLLCYQLDMYFDKWLLQSFCTIPAYLVQMYALIPHILYPVINLVSGSSSSHFTMSEFDVSICAIEKPYSVPPRSSHLTSGAVFDHELLKLGM